jgi:hypothetical protein
MASSRRLLFLLLPVGAACVFVGCSSSSSDEDSGSPPRSADPALEARPLLKGTFNSDQDPLDAPLANLTFDGAGHYKARRRLCRFPCEEEGSYQYDRATGILTLERPPPAAETLRLRIHFPETARKQSPDNNSGGKLVPQNDDQGGGTLVGGSTQLTGTGDQRFSACRLVGGDSECVPFGEYKQTATRSSNTPDAGPSPADAGADREILPEEVSKIKLLSNLKQPKAIVVAYRSRGQSDFIGEMACVAKEQGLRYVIVVKENQEADATSAARAKGCGEGIEVIKEESSTLVTGNDSVFIQDFAEILGATSTKSGGSEKLAVLSLAHPYFLANLPGKVAELLSADVIRPPYESMTVSGQMGGNIEGLPSGGAYVGDSITEPLQGWITARAPSTSVLETKWLVVGHVDEYVGIIPAKTSCGRSVVYADVVGALSLFASMSETEFAAATEHMKKDCAAARVVCPEAEIEFAIYGLEGLKGSIRHFLRDASKAPPYALTDFDLTREPRAAAAAAATATPVDTFIRNNLLLHRDTALPNAQRFAALSDVRGSCSDAEIMTPAPMLFHKSDEGWIADTGGVANFIVLRDRVVVPDAYFPSFRQSISSSMGARGVRPQFMNDAYYHFLQGEIHCGTQVVRDLTSDFRL